MVNEKLEKALEKKVGLGLSLEVLGRTKTNFS
jgi:hypothetical protein